MSSREGRFGASRAAAAIGLTVLAGAIYGATAGLPFTETFDDASLSDTMQTTADWGAATAGNLTLPSAVPLTDPFGPGSVSSTLGGDPQTTRALAFADMNGDGLIDLVEGVDGVNGIFLNDGTGTFATRTPLSGDTTNTRGIAVGDVNGDGFLDVVTANFHSPSRLYLNSGNGTSFTGFDISPDAGPTDSIVLADFNGDGHLDVATAVNGSYRQRVYLNTGDPSAPFGASGVAGQDIDVHGWNSQEVLAGDLNNDGTIDLVFMNQNQINTECLNDGTAHFACHNIGTEADNSQSGALGDVDGDGYLDVIVGNYGVPSHPQTVKVYLNTQDAGDPFGGVTPFEATSPNDPTSVHRVTVADIDNDGDLDILLATAGGTSSSDAAPTTSRLLLNDGTGQNWVMVSIGSDTDVTNYLAAGDVDGDGKLDIVAGNETRDAATEAQPFTDRLYLNTGVASSSSALQLKAHATSVRVDTATSNIASIAMTVDPASVGIDNRADFWVSSNGGTNWLHIAPDGTPLAFPDTVQGQDLRWRVDLRSLSPAAAANLAIDTLTLTADAPAFTSTPITDAKAGAAYEYDVSATDPNGDALTITAPKAPAWLALTDNGDGTAALKGTPAESDVGATVVELDAADATHTTKQTFTLRVASANNAPTFTSTAPTSAAVGDAYSYSIATSDPDSGDTLTLAAPTLPAWLTLTDNGDGTGTLTGTPAEGDVGDAAVELTVTDAAGASATQDFTISVAAGNAAPSFTSTPVTDATAGTAYTYDVAASDPNAGDMLTLAAPTLPAWLTLTDNGDGTGTLTGTPAAGDVGDAAVELTVTDGSGASATQDFTIAVAESPGGGGGNSAPSFTSMPATDATAGTAYSYSIAATDPDSGDTLTLTAPTLPTWLTLTDNGDGTATLTGTPAAGDVGDASVELQVADAAGATAMQSFTISVAAAAGGGGSQNPPSNPPSDSGGGGGGGAGFGELVLLLLAALGGPARRARIGRPRLRATRR